MNNLVEEMIRQEKNHSDICRYTARQRKLVKEPKEKYDKGVNYVKTLALMHK